ncbi:MAG: hypothetical protein U0269_35950 [Polyangiales bacterium]
MATRDRTPTTTAASRGADKLDAAERKVLDEAIERASGVFETVDDAISDLGRWLFTHVFGDDSSAVIEHAQDNAVWRALVAQSDSARVRLTAELLRAAALCAAYDKRLNSDAWRSLDFSRKSRLLRLADDKLLRKGAQHVLASNLGVREVEAYARNVLAELGEPVPTRVNVRAFRGQLAKWTERVGAKSFARQLEGAAKKLDEAEREQLVAELEAAKETLAELVARLQKE